MEKYYIEEVEEYWKSKIIDLNQKPFREMERYIQKFEKYSENRKWQ